MHGTGDLPLPGLLASVSVDWQTSTAPLAQRLGLRVNEGALSGVSVTHVLRGSAAERAGFAPGDELLAVAGWRLRRLDEVQRVLVPGRAAPWLVARDQRVHSLMLALPVSAPAGEPHAVSLTPNEQAGVGAEAAKLRLAALALRKSWLAG